MSKPTDEIADALKESKFVRTSEQVIRAPRLEFCPYCGCDQPVVVVRIEESITHKGDTFHGCISDLERCEVCKEEWGTLGRTREHTRADGLEEVFLRSALLARVRQLDPTRATTLGGTASDEAAFAQYGYKQALLDVEHVILNNGGPRVNIYAAMGRSGLPPDPPFTPEEYSRFASQKEPY